MTARNVALLGSTGSIGDSSLDLMDRLEGTFKVVSLSAGTNVERLAAQVRRYRPAAVPSSCRRWPPAIARWEGRSG